jgi:predicted nicotinamide N-methyase
VLTLFRGVHSSDFQVNLFAHCVWNAAILTADFISSGYFSVDGESVLELGAGAGLPGILSALKGAELVVLSDYESPELLNNLQRNVKENISEKIQCKVKVEGHVWGQPTKSITQYVRYHDALLIDRHRETFSRIITADCFWISDRHEDLVRSLCRLLERSTTSRIFFVAGLHTGRSVIANFFRVAASQGLTPGEDGITEHNVINGCNRPWKEERGKEDTVVMKRWLIVARLRWFHL